ncbi:MAG: four helix bundle protein [Bifidobacteriaceae bacterium]|nr:four helix bundle protein [Bifidobacteriaceae bacterium]
MNRPSQIRRAAVSVPSNIAEGFARKYIKEIIRFLAIARGFVAEAETQLLLAYRLGYISDKKIVDKFLEVLDEISRMIYSFSKKSQTYLSSAI